jgi:protein-S-isoprenylcysteine O-methyltransferase Ste14
MEALDQLSTTLALSMGLAWASGLNLYATLFTLGYLANTGNIALPENLQIVADPMVMSAAGLMYLVEFFADKVPGVDTGWDAIHTFVRIPAGAMLAAGAIGDLNPAVELAAAIMGGSLAAGTHATKAGARVLINTSPEPFSNWLASISEDIAVVSGVWACINHPVLFIVALIAFILLMIWLLPKILSGIKKVLRFIINLFVKEPKPTHSPPQ